MSLSSPPALLRWAGVPLAFPKASCGLKKARPPQPWARLPSPKPGRKPSAQKKSSPQVLVTLTDTEERRRHLNARATLTTLLAQGAVPVINENDTVATSEIRYGDNDRLAARVASMMSADCLVLLSDIDGLYSAPPDRAGATFIPEVREITAEIEAMAGKSMSGRFGGMITKIERDNCAGAGAQVIASATRSSLRALQGRACKGFWLPCRRLSQGKLDRRTLPPGAASL